MQVMEDCMTTPTPPEAVEAAKGFACKLHDAVSRQNLYPYIAPGEGVHQACIRILAARVRELERERQPEQARESDEVLYGLGGQELLDEDIDELLRRLIDNNCDQPGESFDSIADRMTWPVKVLKFKRATVSESHKKSLATSALEGVLESLDEDHSDPGGDYTKPTAPMQLAARRFVDEVVRHYVVWNCEPTGEVVEVTREMAKEIVR